MEIRGNYMNFLQFTDSKKKFRGNYRGNTVIKARRKIYQVNKSSYLNSSLDLPFQHDNMIVICAQEFHEVLFQKMVYRENLDLQLKENETGP